jgi:hypothetical protein
MAIVISALMSDCQNYCWHQYHIYKIAEKISEYDFEGNCKSDPANQKKQYKGFKHLR